MSGLQPESVDASFYAVVIPTWSGYGRDASGNRILDGAKVERITQKKPNVVRGGGIVTRLTLRIDATALLPLAPEAIIHVSPGQVEVMHVQADAPESEEE